MATKQTTVKTLPANPAFDAILERLQKAAGWEIIGEKPNLAALSTVGTTVLLNKKGQIEINNLSQDIKRIAAQTADAKTVAKLVVEVNTTAIKAATTGIPVVSAETTNNKPEEKTMATKPTTTKPTTTKPTTTIPTTTKPAVTETLPPEKTIGKPLANPAGEATPIFDSLKKIAETDEKAKNQLKSMWESFGVTYEFKVGNLTKALLAEGLWPASKDKDGDYKAGEDGLQVPVGYQKIYKEEKDQGIKGIGHLVNVAAASFGRHNMEKATPPVTTPKGTTPAESTPDEKQLAKLLLNIEKLAIKISAEDLRDYLEKSKAFAPALAIIKEQEAALGAL